MVAALDRKAGEEVGFSMDKWTSCERERRDLLKFMGRPEVKNPVVLTGDIHSNWAAELLLDFEGHDSRPVGTEFVGTSISSGGDGHSRSEDYDATMSENPFLKFYNRERGYVACDLNENEWKTHYRTVDYVTRKGSPIRTRASFLVENGRPVINQV